jgi:hypothetical protein
MTKPLPKKSAIKKIPPRRFAGQQAIGAALDVFTRPLLKQRGIVSSRVITDWPSIVGHYLSSMCQPKKVTFPRGEGSKGTLHIEVFYSGIATELEYIKEDIIERIAVFYGFQAITNIRIIQSPAPLGTFQQNKQPFFTKTTTQESNSPLTQMIEKELSEVEDGELRDALLALGTHIKRE